MSLRIEKFEGFPIFHDVEGYYWLNGTAGGGGYFDTLEECRESISDFNDEEAAMELEMFGGPDDARDGALDPHGPWGAP